MDINIDTRKMKFKKGDILIYDENRFTIISKDELLAPLYKEITKLRKDLEIECKKNEMKLDENIDKIKLENIEVVKGLISR